MADGDDAVRYCRQQQYQVKLSMEEEEGSRALPEAREAALPGVAVCRAEPRRTSSAGVLLRQSWPEGQG